MESRKSLDLINKKLVSLLVDMCLLAAGCAPAQRKPAGVASRKYVCEEGSMVQLRRLILSYNMLALLPEEIGNLRSLERHCLVSNRLTSLPRMVETLMHMTVPVLTNNPLAEHGEISETCLETGLCFRATRSKCKAVTRCLLLSPSRVHQETQRSPVENVSEHRPGMERSLASGGAHSRPTSRCGKKDENGDRVWNQPRRIHGAKNVFALHSSHEEVFVKLRDGVETQGHSCRDQGYFQTGRSRVSAWCARCCIAEGT
ncbi:UNVERIFIED_CONTAM: hypothetical protein PYX00_011515 [Menopon gallinae]|uniref:Uncharacterized protein n=1 Tax=Menopon gallinae TaxID=328185 RepID=A0AAW2H7Z5_9NEOP